MATINNYKFVFLFLLTILITTPLLAEDSKNSPKLKSHLELLNSIKAKKQKAYKVQQQREKLFRSDLAKQTSLLAKAKKRRDELSTTYNSLAKEFVENEESISTLSEKVKLQLGTLGELEGIVKEEAVNFASRQAITPLVLPSEQQQKRLTEIKKKQGIPTLSSIRTLWELAFEELTNTGQSELVKRAKVASPDGSVQEVEVESFGPFLFFVKGTGEFLAWSTETKMFEVPDVQLGLSPKVKGVDNLTLRTIDPTFGGLVLAEANKPNWIERLLQGGFIGFVIVGIGVLGLLVSFFRGMALIRENAAVKKLVKVLSQQDSLSSILKLDNQGSSLGRTLQVCNESNLNFDDLEYRLEEQILNERMKLEKGVYFIKLCAAVAPLLGLLGTVTGMITTFQVITVQGTSDPSQLAGGISQALVTTKLGLIVAIPLLFIHGLIKSPLHRIFDILDSQSAGILARVKEDKNNQKSTTSLSVAS